MLLDLLARIAFAALAGVHAPFLALATGLALFAATREWRGPAGDVYRRAWNVAFAASVATWLLVVLQVGLFWSRGAHAIGPVVGTALLVDAVAIGVTAMASARGLARIVAAGALVSLLCRVGALASLEQPGDGFVRLALRLFALAAGGVAASAGAFIAGVAAVRLRANASDAVDGRAFGLGAAAVFPCALVALLGLRPPPPGRFAAVTFGAIVVIGIALLVVGGIAFARRRAPTPSLRLLAWMRRGAALASVAVALGAVLQVATLQPWLATGVIKSADATSAISPGEAAWGLLALVAVALAIAGVALHLLAAAGHVPEHGTTAEDVP